MNVPQQSEQKAVNNDNLFALCTNAPSVRGQMKQCFAKVAQLVTMGMNSNMMSEVTLPVI